MEVQMTGQRIQHEIQSMFCDSEYGFEVFIYMKEEPVLRRFILYEGDPEDESGKDNFKRSVQDTISDTIRQKYLAEDAVFESAEKAADDQNKFYVIQQDDEYSPFGFTGRGWHWTESFRIQDRDLASGILFRFCRGARELWAYQHIYAMTIPNKKKKSFLSVQQEDVFVEMKDTLFSISRNVDLLIIGTEIITDNIRLMQAHFKFQDFIKNAARETVSSIENLHLVSNPEKLSDYIKRAKIGYAKKMMRIKKSKVLEQPPDVLLEKIQTLPRWKGRFVIENNQIVLSTYPQVESLIELFDETYTRSDVTGEEYETDVKRLARPVG